MLQSDWTAKFLQRVQIRVYSDVTQPSVFREGWAPPNYCKGASKGGVE